MKVKASNVIAGLTGGASSVKVCASYVVFKSGLGDFSGEDITYPPNFDLIAENPKYKAEIYGLPDQCQVYARMGGKLCYFMADNLTVYESLITQAKEKLRLM